MGEKTSVLSPPKTISLGHLIAVQQLITVALHTEEEESRYWGLSVFLMDISRIFYVSKQTECDVFMKTVTMLMVKGDTVYAN